MRITNFVGAAIALFFLFCALALSDYDSEPRFSSPPEHVGRPLTPQQWNTVQDAINNIGTPPTDSITYTDENGDTHRTSCWDIAWDLEYQLHDSAIEGETGTASGNWTNPDGRESTEGDGMNLDTGLVGRAGQADSNLRALEGVLVHEWVHKTQDSASLSDTSGREIEPYGAMKAYYCSTGVDCTGGDWLPGWANDQLAKRRKEYEDHQIVRDDLARLLGDNYVFVRSDTVDDGHDSLICQHLSGSYRHGYPLWPMRGSDFYILENHWMLPPEHDLIVICGGMPGGVASILALDFLEGEVIGPVWNQDYAPPDYPPMFFFSMERSQMPEFWFVVDSIQNQILYMQDFEFGDGIPDEIVSVFADAAWPGFEPMQSVLGADKFTHPFMGSGILANFSEAHLYELLYPYDVLPFLMDPDGDMHADFMMPLPLYEFLQIRPAIQVPLPWPEDIWVNLYATWEHDIAVWTTDESGETLMEQLGMVHMAPGIDMECPLARPLLGGEYVMPLDIQTNQRGHPIMVDAPAPQNLVMQIDPGGGVLMINWGPVEGAGQYAIWSSDDGVNFFDTGLRTTDPSLDMPLPPLEKQFYHVTAIR
jgi:hypothetical protein